MNHIETFYKSGNVYGTNILCIPSMLTSQLTLFLPNLCICFLDLHVKIHYCIVNHNACCCCDCMHEVVVWSSNFEYKDEEEKPSVESTN